MNQNNHVNQTSPDVGYFQHLFYEWFVRYNPLYFVSAACFIFGVFLVSKGLTAIDWIDGQVALTGVIEFYQLLLLAGSFILCRLASQKRPAAILAVMNIVFLFDCTYQTEHLSFAGSVGAFSTALWVVLFAVKLIALTWIFRLKLPVLGFVVPILAAMGIAWAPYLLYRNMMYAEFIHLAMTWYGVALAVAVLYFRPAVMWRDKLDIDSKTMILRISKAAWLIWAGFFLFHLISWIRFFEVAINLANVAPIFIILAFASKKEEASWAGCILTVTLSSAYPPLFWLTAFLSGMVLCLNAWKNRQPRLYIGAILCFHFALATLYWKSGPFPDPDPWLPVLTGIGLIFIGWTFRLISAFCLVGLGVLVFWNPRGPRDIMEWGSLFIAIGFASLVAGIIVNWKFGFMSVSPAKGQTVPPSKNSNFTEADQLLQAHHNTEVRRKMANNLEDPCPYCKFNLAAGGDKCQECGRKLI
jgi:hypothetical protein